MRLAPTLLRKWFLANTQEDLLNVIQHLKEKNLLSKELATTVLELILYPYNTDYDNIYLSNRDRLRIMKDMISIGADVNHNMKLLRRNFSLLSLAIGVFSDKDNHKSIDAVKYLVKQGANIDHPSVTLNHLLFDAFHEDRKLKQDEDMKTISFLLSHSNDPHLMIQRTRTYLKQRNNETPQVSRKLNEIQYALGSAQWEISKIIPHTYIVTPQMKSKSINQKQIRIQSKLKDRFTDKKKRWWTWLFTEK